MLACQIFERRMCFCIYKACWAATEWNWCLLSGPVQGFMAEKRHNGNMTLTYIYLSLVMGYHTGHMFFRNLKKMEIFMSAYLCLLWPDALLKVEKLTILPTYCSVQIFCWSLKCAFFWFACSVSSAPVTASDNTRNPATTECLTLKLKEIWWSNPFLAVWTVVKYGELSLLLP